MDRIFIIDDDGIKEKLEKYLIANKKHIKFFQSNEIIRFKANQDKTITFLTNEKVVEINKTIDNIEQQFENQPFMRKHDDHIVNLHYVSRIINDNTVFLELTNNQEVPLSNLKKEILLQQLYKFLK